MTGIGDLIRKFNETDRHSREYIAGLQRISTFTLTVGRALANVYLASSSAVSGIIEAAAKHSQKMRSLLLMRLISGLPPIFELEGAEAGKELVPSLRSLKFSISWRIVPLTKFVENILSKLRKRATELSVAGVLRKPPLFPPPLASETMGMITEYADRISRISQRAYETTSAVTTRVSFDYAKKIPRAQRVFDIIGRRAAEAFDHGALAAMPPVVEAVETIREVAEKLVVPAPVSPAAAITSRYVLATSEMGRAPQSIAERIAETYGVKVLGAISPFAEAVSEKIAEAPSAEALGVLGRYPTAEALGRVVRYAPTIADIGALGYDLMRQRAAEVYAVKTFGVRPPVETIMIDRLLKRRRRVSEILSRKVVDAYGLGVPITRAPPVVEAVETIREVAEKLVVPAPVSPAAAITSRYVLATSEMGRAPQSIAERIAETYGVKVLGAISPTIKAVGEGIADVYGLGVPITRAPPVVEAVETIREVSGLMGGLSVPALPTVELARRGKHVLTIPEIKKVFRLITERVAEAYRIEVLSLIPPPVEAVAERAVKAPGVGLPEALRTYPAAEIMEVARVLSSEASRITREVSGVMRDRYRGVLSGVPPVREYLAMGRVFKEGSEVSKGFELAKAVSRGVPSVVRPLSAVETVRAAGSYVSVMSEISQVFDVLGAISREAVASGLETRRGLVEGVSRVGLEGIVRGVVGGAVVKPLHIDAEKLGLERVSLGLPGVVRTVKLHEIIPILHALRPQVAPRERQPVIKNMFNVTVTATSLEDERDLRNLERKIRRILEREARRYGVST